MSLSISFHVLADRRQLTDNQLCVPQQTIRSSTSLKEFIAQFINVASYGVKGCSSPIVDSYPCPQGFWIYTGSRDEEHTTTATDGYNRELRFIFADQLLKIAPPTGAGPLDLAMMAYLTSLAENAPNAVVVLYPS